MSKLRLLVVEDNEPTARTIAATLKRGGITCDLVANGVSAIKIAKVSHYDLITIDLILKDINGIDLIQHMRKAGVQVPIMVVSAVSAVDKKIQSLNLGADDYITKPFNSSEFLARIQSICRRVSRPASKSIIRIGDFVINLVNRTISIGGRPLTTTYKEYSIVELMAIRRGTVVSKEAILNHLYPSEEIKDTKIVDVFICKLRKKISKLAQSKNFIETVWGKGYTLRALENIHRQKGKRELTYY